MCSRIRSIICPARSASPTTQPSASPDLAQVWRLLVQEIQRRAGVVARGGDRLRDFVSQRRGQFSHHAQTVHVGEIRLQLAQLLLLVRARFRSVTSMSVLTTSCSALMQTSPLKAGRRISRSSSVLCTGPRRTDTGRCSLPSRNAHREIDSNARFRRRRMRCRTLRPPVFGCATDATGKDPRRSPRRQATTAPRSARCPFECGNFVHRPISHVSVADARRIRDFGPPRWST